MNNLIQILFSLYWVGFILAAAISSMIIIFSYSVIDDEDATLLNTLATIILTSFLSWYFILKVLKTIFYKLYKK
ncbi:hypothetical protein [Fusobacterium sp.]|uniref:hypothetical protein n=1 Tax=Fusobacterium sp. TaxID=68766 RepID=UPI0026064549|nr:hypothetical protein [Fusobacterium sp.]